MSGTLLLVCCLAFAHSLFLLLWSNLLAHVCGINKYGFAGSVHLPDVQSADLERPNDPLPHGRNMTHGVSAWSVQKHAFTSILLDHTGRIPLFLLTYSMPPLQEQGGGGGKICGVADHRGVGAGGADGRAHARQPD